MRARWGDVVDAATESSLPGGAALASNGTVWVLAEDQPERSLGAALVWARRHQPADDPGDEVHVLAASSAGTLARRATLFRQKVTVWAIEGTELVAAVADPLAAEAPLDPRAEPFREVIERAGAEAVVEGGLLRAEVLGLEVARVEVDEAGARLAVGVGKHDREAQREVHGVEQGFDNLFEVVRVVAEHRVPDGEGSAAYHLASERWLRAVVVRRPELVGAATLHPVPSPVERIDLRHAAVAPAAGEDLNGEPVAVLCSVGTDLDLVPSAVDAWSADGREPRLIFVVPEGDDYPVTRELVASLSIPAELTTVPADWRGR